VKPAVADGGGLPIQVILGPCDDMRAEVFVRVASSEVPNASLRLAGELAGPECRRSITLPAGAALADLGPGEAGLLAKAVLTEPAFWTPELPNLYRLTARLAVDGRTVAETTRRIGLRRSGVRGRSLWLEGRRWVPRGVACASYSCDVKAIHEAGVAAVVVDPPEDFLAAADEAGLAIIGVAEADDGRSLAADEIVDRIGRWSMHPAVVITLLPQAVAEADVAALATQARRLKGTMLVARAVDGASPPPGSVAAGVDGLCVILDRGGLPHDAWREAAPAVPHIAWQRGDAGKERARTACDRLQAALAAWGLAEGRTEQPWDWAGYLVS
jgi:hypothetical protein